MPIAIVGTYSSSTPKHPRTPMAVTHNTRISVGPNYPALWLHKSAGGQAEGLVSGMTCEGQSELTPEAESEQSEGNNRRRLHHQHNWRQQGASVCSPHNTGTHTGPWLQLFVPLGKDSGVGRREYIHLKGREPARARLSRLLSQELGIRTCSQ